MDVKREEVDVLCTGGEKRLLTPYFGIGFMYARRELLERLEPPTGSGTERGQPADVATSGKIQKKILGAFRASLKTLRSTGVVGESPIYPQRRSERG